MALPRTVVVGPLQVNCLLWPCGDGGALVIDPGAEAGAIEAALARLGLEPVAVALTHGHPDHLGAAGELAHGLGLDVYLHPDDGFLVEALRGDWPMDFGPAPTRWPELQAYPERLTYPELELQVKRLPGHSPGSVALYGEADACVCVGDVLFAGSVGRTDLPGGDEGRLLESIETGLLTLPDETIVIPGHGPRTTIGEERALNPFLLP